jgi:hypothetical protein
MFQKTPILLLKGLTVIRVREGLAGEFSWLVQFIQSTITFSFSAIKCQKMQLIFVSNVSFVSLVSNVSNIAAHT